MDRRDPGRAARPSGAARGRPGLHLQAAEGTGCAAEPTGSWGTGRNPCAQEGGPCRHGGPGPRLASSVCAGFLGEAGLSLSLCPQGGMSWPRQAALGSPRPPYCCRLWPGPWDLSPPLRARPKELHTEASTGGLGTQPHPEPGDPLRPPAVTAGRDSGSVGRGQDRTTAGSCGLESQDPMGVGSLSGRLGAAPQSQGQGGWAGSRKGSRGCPI